jgi:hypothetical protein
MENKMSKAKDFFKYVLCNFFGFKERYRLSFTWHYGQETMWNYSSREDAEAHLEKWKNTFKAFKISHVKIEAYLVSMWSGESNE